MNRRVRRVENSRGASPKLEEHFPLPPDAVDHALPLARQGMSAPSLGVPPDQHVVGAVEKDQHRLDQPGIRFIEKAGQFFRQSGSAQVRDQDDCLEPRCGRGRLTDEVPQERQRQVVDAVVA